MSRRAIFIGIAGLGCLVACAAAQVPAPTPNAANVVGPDASAVVVESAVRTDTLDAGPGTPDVVEAAVASSARDASMDDDSDAGAKLVFDLGAARAGQARLAVLVNVEAFRANSSGRQLGPVIQAITRKEAIPHVEDLGIAWLLFTGPSLQGSAKGTLLMYCTAPDAKIDRWIDGMRTANSAPVDAGPGVHAVRGHADSADRVFLRPQSHLVAMVPPDLATTAVTLLRDARMPAHADPTEAFRFRARNPQRAFSELPASVTEMRFVIKPRKDQGADFVFEVDTPGAAIVAQQLHDFLDHEVDVATRNATLGVFDHPDITASGDVATVHVRASEAQLSAMLQIILAELH
jgi:hypothetical protein